MDTNALEVNIRIVLLGKTGAGKSSAGNTILGRKSFETGLSSSTECQKDTQEFEGQKVSVVDTPGLLNTELPAVELKKKIRKCISIASPGPHVFLVVIQAGRFTEEEQETVRIIKKMFGECAAHYTMVLFTHGDDLEADGASTEKFIKENQFLRGFIHHCGERYHVFNNRDGDPSQVTNLLKKINTMVQTNGGSYYTNEMFKDTEREKKIHNAPAADGAPVIGDAEKTAKQDIRMVLVGTAGVGKSSAGNTILRKKAFKTGLSACTQCEMLTGDFEGQTLAIVDTPGLLDTDLPEEEVKREITKCISLAAPGPHVFLVVLRGGRLTEDDQETVRIIQMFGKKAACYTMVLFTCGDNLKADGDKIQHIISEDKALSDLISQCDGRYQVFNNRDGDPSQVRELLEKINTMVHKNGGSYFTNEMFREAERVNNEEMQRLQIENPNMTPEAARIQVYGGSQPIKKNNKCAIQ